VPEPPYEDWLELLDAVQRLVTAAVCSRNMRASAPPDSRAFSRGENLVRRRLDKPGRFGLKTHHVHAFAAGNDIVSRRNFDGRLRRGERAKRTPAKKPTGLFQNWPTNADPKTVGEKVARNFLQRDYLTNKAGFIVYPEACTAFGALRFAGLQATRNCCKNSPGVTR